MAESRKYGQGLNLKLIVAFAAVYLIWGSTFLAIRYAIESIPPFLMAGVRYLTAGCILYFFARIKGAPRPERRYWKTASILGALLFLAGNGVVVWSEQRVASGLTALLIATEPLWIAILDWLRPGGRRPDLQVALGLLLGFGASALLVAPGRSAGGVDIIGALVVMGGALSWALGSLYSRHAYFPSSPMLGAGMQLVAGGIQLLIFASLAGEWHSFHLSAVSVTSVLCLIYLITFGAVVGFSCYNYLLKTTTSARASTYAYVNPVVAVFLGWLVAGERITGWTIGAASAIALAVLLITTHKAKEHDTETKKGKSDEMVTIPGQAEYETP